jgi:hypothetical protein
LHRTATGRYNVHVLALGASLPRLVRWGMGILLVGLALDVVVHALGRADGLAAAVGHTLVLVGMLIALAGTVRLAFRRRTEGEGHAGADLAVR